MLALGKTGRGLFRRTVIFTCDNHCWPTNATWARDLYTFSGFLMGKSREKLQGHNMTQIASVLAVVAVFISLIYRQRRGAYTCDKNAYAGTWAKSAGGLIHEGGRNFGILWYCFHHLLSTPRVTVQFSIIIVLFVLGCWGQARCTGLDAFWIRTIF